MGTHVIALMDERHDTLRGTVLLSLILHAVLFVAVVTYTMIGFHLGGGGQEWGTQGATRVGAVSSLPGVPLPAPMLTTPSQVATQNTGLYKTEPQPKEELPPDAQQIPKFKDAVKPEKLERVNKRIHKTEEVPQRRPLWSDRRAHDELYPNGDFRRDGRCSHGRGEQFRAPLRLVRGIDACARQCQLADGDRQP